MARSKVTGMKQIKKNLKIASKGINRNVRSGFVSAVRFIKTKSLQETPVELGDLKRSAFTKITSGSGWINGIVGYSVIYAGKVHASRGVLMGEPRRSGIGNYWDPNGQPLFLSYALSDNISTVFNMIASSSSKAPI